MHRVVLCKGSDRAFGGQRRCGSRRRKSNAATLTERLGGGNLASESVTECLSVLLLLCINVCISLVGMQNNKGQRNASVVKAAAIPQSSPLSVSSCAGPSCRVQRWDPKRKNRNPEQQQQQRQEPPPEQQEKIRFPVSSLLSLSRHFPSFSVLFGSHSHNRRAHALRDKARAKTGIWNRILNR